MEHSANGSGAAIVDPLWRELLNTVEQHDAWGELDDFLLALRTIVDRKRKEGRRFRLHNAVSAQADNASFLLEVLEIDVRGWRAADFRDTRKDQVISGMIRLNRVAAEFKGSLTAADPVLWSARLEKREREAELAERVKEHYERLAAGMSTFRYRPRQVSKSTTAAAGYPLLKPNNPAPTLANRRIATVCDIVSIEKDHETFSPPRKISAGPERLPIGRTQNQGIL